MLITLLHVTLNLKMCGSLSPVIQTPVGGGEKLNIGQNLLQKIVRQ